MNSLGKRIAYIRKKLSLNQDEFGSKLGVKGKGTVSGWERNERTPDIQMLASIADIGNVSFEWLAKGSGEMSLMDTILNKVTENEHIYGDRISIPVVGKISSDKYDPGDVISQVMFDRNEINPTFFFLYMYEEKLATKGSKVIWKGDLLLINPNIKDIYPGDLVAVVTHSGRQWVRYVENWDHATLQLQGGIRLNGDEVAGMYRIVKIRPAEFEV